MNWAPEDLARLANIAAETHYGHGDGGRRLNLQTQHETAEWRSRAAAQEAAMRRLNGLLPPAPHIRNRQEGVTFLGDHTSFNGHAVQSALADYRQTCAAALLTPEPKPRRILSMIRLAAELVGAPDPVWSAAQWGSPMNHADFAMNRLFRQTERALKAGGFA